MSLARCGYADLIQITDGQESVVENIERNLQVSSRHTSVGLASEVWVSQYVWSVDPEEEEVQNEWPSNTFRGFGTRHPDVTRYPFDNGRPDLIVGSDLVYDPDVVPALCATINRLLPTRLGALIVFEERNPLTWAVFLEELERIGLAVKHIPLLKQDGIYDLPQGGTLLDEGTFHCILINTPDMLDQFAASSD